MPFLTFCLGCTLSHGQSISDSIRLASIYSVDSTGMKLAELATNNALLKVSDLEIKARKYELGRSKAAWLTNFSASFNLNEFNIKASSLDQQNVFFPRYNFGVTIPASYFFTKSSDVKIARAGYEQAKARKEMELLQLKQTIVAKYNEYRTLRSILTLHDKTLQDELVLFESAEDKFTKGEINLSAFTDASKRYNNELVTKMTLTRNLANLRLELESLLGMNLNEALAKVR
jgi:outer membrane protein TolC